MRKKEVKKDFNESNMPHNRIEVFKDIVFNRSSTLFSLGLMILLFSIPLILALLFSNMALSSLDLSEYSDEKYNEFLLLINTKNLFSLIGIMVLSLGLSGAYKIIRMLIWQEGIFFINDFFKGIKQNFKGFLLTGFFIGLLNMVCQYLYYNFKITEYAFMASMIVSIFFIPTVLFILNQSTIYNLKYKEKFKNALLISWRHFYTSIPILLLNALFIIFPMFINNTIAYMVIILMIPVIIGPLLILFDTLYTDTLLDKYINSIHFKEIYDKGIYRKWQK